MVLFVLVLLHFNDFLVKRWGLRKEATCWDLLCKTYRCSRAEKRSRNRRRVPWYNSIQSIIGWSLSRSQMHSNAPQSVDLLWQVWLSGEHWFHCLRQHSSHQGPKMEKRGTDGSGLTWSAFQRPLFGPPGLDDARLSNDQMLSFLGAPSLSQSERFGKTMYKQITQA